jgi:hypothetical protein
VSALVWFLGVHALTAMSAAGSGNRWVTASSRIKLVALPSSWRTPGVVVCSLHLSRWCGRCPEPGNKHQGVPEHEPRHGDLGHLERHVTTMADDLCAILISFSRRLAVAMVPPPWIAARRRVAVVVTIGGQRYLPTEFNLIRAGTRQSHAIGRSEFRNRRVLRHAAAIAGSCELGVPVHSSGKLPSVAVRCRTQADCVKSRTERIPPRRMRQYNLA